MNKHSLPALVGGILIALLILSGCSVTGWSTKKIPDGSDIKPGEPVTIVQKDGRTVTGEFRGTKEMAYSEYVEYIGMQPLKISMVTCYLKLVSR